jgi:hypothetical protein
MHLDAGTQPPRQLLLEIAHRQRLGLGHLGRGRLVAGLGPLLFEGALGLPLAHHLLGLPDAQPAPGDLVGDLLHHALVGGAEERAGVPLGEVAPDHHAAHPRRELQQAKAVGDRRAVLLHEARERLVRVGVLADEPIEGLGQLDGVEIFSLDVLDQRQLERLGRRDVLDDDLDLGEPGLLRRPPAALAGDDLVALGAPGDAPDDDGLDQAVVADRGGQLLEGELVEPLPRLPLGRDDLVDRAEEHVALERGARRRGGGDGKQRVEAPAQRARFLFDHDRALVWRTSLARLR